MAFLSKFAYFFHYSRFFVLAQQIFFKTCAFRGSLQKFYAIIKKHSLQGMKKYDMM